MDHQPLTNHYRDVEELVKTSPSPDVTEGTNTIEIFVAGYLLSPRYRSPPVDPPLTLLTP